MIYFVILLLLVLLSYRYDYCRREQGRMVWIIVIWLLFVLIAGLRYRIGTDSIRYETFYGELPGLDNLRTQDFTHTKYARFGPGYIFLNSVVKTFSDDFMIFQFVHALIVCSAVVYFLYKNARSVFFALAMFFVFQYLNLLTEVLRESLAVSVFLLAWPFFRDGKWIQWYLMSLLALTFHISAAMMFVLPLLCIPGLRELFVFGKRTIPVFIFIVIMAIAINKMFFQYIQLLELSDNVSDRATAYSKSAYGTSSLSFFGVLYYVIVYITYPMIALYYITRRDGGVRLKNDFSKVEMLSLLSMYVVIFTLFIQIMGRFNNYLIFFSILVLSDFVYTNIHQLNKVFRLKFIYWLMFVTPLFCGHIYSAYISAGSKGGTYKAYMAYYPYSSRLEMSKDQTREKFFRYLRAR